MAKTRRIPGGKAGEGLCADLLTVDDRGGLCKSAAGSIEPLRGRVLPFQRCVRTRWIAASTSFDGVAKPMPTLPPDGPSSAMSMPTT